MKTTRFSVKALVLATFVVVVMSGCDWLQGMIPLSDSERAAAFIQSVNASPQDAVEIQSHFHPTVGDYSSMNTATYWENTLHFAPTDQTISISSMSAGGEIAPYTGTTSYSGTLTNANDTYTIQFAFLEDPEVSGNRLIRAIVVTGSTGDTLDSVR